MILVGQVPSFLRSHGFDLMKVLFLEAYEKLGYENISTRKGYYGPGLDAFVMRKELK